MPRFTKMVTIGEGIWEKGVRVEGRGGISRKFDRKRVKILYHYIIFFFSSKKSRHLE